MKRRNFIKQSALASSVFFVPSLVRAFEHMTVDTLGLKKLVIIQMTGGNDGLNTIIPYTNDIYYRSRPNIAIQKQELIKATDQIGFHNNLSPLMQLYDKGYLSVLNNVGYPNPNRSHFRSTDIWQTASDANEFLSTGWLGRYLDEGDRKAYEGIEVDDSLSLILKGKERNGIATKNPEPLYQNMHTPYFDKMLQYQQSDHLSEHNLGYLYKTMIEAKSSANYIYENSKTYRSNFVYPDNPFGKQLKTTAEFINSHLQTKVYYISMGGFDTHVNQINRHNRLLETYSSAIDVFVKDLEKHSTFEDTLILTFSEFGRRLTQNAANGTDHGAANNVFLIGKKLKNPGFYNDMPDLSNLDTNGDPKHTIDFRSIYATILHQWLQVNDKAILKHSFPHLGFLHS